MKSELKPIANLVPHSIFYELPDEIVNDPSRITAELAEYVEALRRTCDETLLRMEHYNSVHDAKVFANPIPPRLITGWHRHDFFEINYVFSGQVYEYIEDRVTVLGKGDLLIMNPNVFHALYASTDALAFNILIEADFFREIADRMTGAICPGTLSYLAGHNAYIIFASVRERVLDDAVFEIVSMFRHFRPLPHEAIRGIIVSPYDIYLLHRNTETLLARICACEAAKELTVTRRGSTIFADKFDNIIAYIRANIAIVCAEDVAKRFGYSRMQIYRMIKAHFGIGFREYVMSLRLKSAQTLLAETNDGISKICRSVGLSEEYFYRFFKKELGITPTQFRKLGESERRRMLIPLSEMSSCV